MVKPGITQIPNPVALRITGADRLAFLHRQTTNAVNSLTPGHITVTVLTNPMARILDVLTVICLDDALLVICLPGRGLATLNFFRQRIFFNDQVEVHDVSADWQILLISGDAAGPVRQIGLDQTPQPGKFLYTDWHTHPLIAWQQTGFQANGLILAVNPAGAVQLREAFGHTGLAELSADAVELRRIEAGLAGHPNELNDKYTPLETDLRPFIHDSKGCYTGQEIIARQLTYDKVTQSLVGIRLAGPAQAGSPLTADDRPAGVLTSVVQSPRFGWIGLGIVKRPHNQSGSNLVLTSQDGSTIPVVVAELPFR